MIPRIPTGIAFLDRDLGGFYRQRIYVLCGGDDSAKRILAAHFLRAGLETGESCLWMAPEKMGDRLIALGSAGFGFSDYLQSGTFTCAEYHAPRAGLTGSFQKELDAAGADIVARGVERLVIDSAQVLFANEPKRCRPDCVSAFARFCEKLHTSTLLLLDTPAGPQANALKDLLVDQATGAFALAEAQDDDERNFLRMTTEKLVGQDGLPAWDFEIVAGNRISLISKEDLGRAWMRAGGHGAAPPLN